ncbi:hypothetical protein ACH40F_07770 [Streptomyces sp. NPDC020794]|uniref:hypothetical protein n=1 Tax=unclassified Streptomyces TaxID=2593676 RepID=UPI0036E041A1
MPSPELPAPAPVEPLPTGPRCSACAEPAVVNWRRRLTDDELAAHVRAEQDRRAQALLLADPQLPTPAFPPILDGTNDTRTVYACADHAITMDGAALIHASSCTAPNEGGMHGCDCTPEPVPDTPTEEEPVQALPDHWVTGGA